MAEEQRVALVTGASAGIGRATATRLGELGVAVALNYPDDTELENVDAAVADIESMDGRAVAVRADVADDGAVREMVEETASKLGRIDYLVNNAGTNVRKAPQEYTLEEWHLVVDVNLTGTFLCSKEVYPLMAEAGGG
ncbi:MAG: SDR family NAD(P)-dependent oxidoreductase, partial [Chloroflexota bacterium]|nr:SDR family NAD(P)-dependent oxidoreductase [Chloroflexota bacterium]